MRIALAAIALLAAAPAAADPTEPAFRALFREMVETDTSPSAGSCTLAAERLAARFHAAGFPAADVHRIIHPDHPKDGSLVVHLPGTNPQASAILLMGHLDVVDARPEDWQHPPFVLREEGGRFTARGVADMKALNSIWADSLIRFKAAPRLRRTLKLMLTCGEETTEAFNGARWLAENRRELIDARFALNEGGGGRAREDGKPELLSIQVGEKRYQDFRLEVTNPGGHSSRPVPENAIYRLAAAVQAVQAHRFPLRLNPTTTVYFANAAALFPAPIQPHMKAIAADPGDSEAEAVLALNPTLDAMLRTTCVATRLSAGHANNALPQRATAIVNCRIIPGDTVEGTATAIAAAVADPGVSLTQLPSSGKPALVVPLDDAVIGPAKAVAARHFPGTPLLPTMSTGATDGPFLSAVGIPVYGVPGLLTDPGGSNAHGLDERIGVAAVMQARAYLFDLVRAYAQAP